MFDFLSSEPWRFLKFFQVQIIGGGIIIILNEWYFINKFLSFLSIG